DRIHVSRTFRPLASMAATSLPAGCCVRPVHPVARPPNALSKHRDGSGMNWDREAEIVVIGSGATGLPAAIVAREAGCSVILVEAEKDIGGHAIISGGN